MGKKLIQNLEDRLLRELDNQIHSWSTLKEISKFTDVDLAIRVSLLVAENARRRAEITFINLIEEIKTRSADDEQSNVIERLAGNDGHFITCAEELPKAFIKAYDIKDAVDDLNHSQSPLETGYSELDRHFSIKPGTVTTTVGDNAKIALSFQLNLLLNMLIANPDRQFYFIGYKYKRYELLAKILMILSGFTFHDIDTHEGFLKYLREAKDNKGTISEIDAAIAHYEQFTSGKALHIINPIYDSIEFTMFMDEIAGQNRPGVVFIDDFAALRPMMASDSIDRSGRNAVCFLRKLSARYGVPVICGHTLRQRKNDMDDNEKNTIDPADFLATVGEEILQNSRTILRVYPKTGQPDDPGNINEKQIICRCMQSETDDSDWAAEFTWHTDTLKIY